MKKKFFTLLTLLLTMSSGVWAADSECTYTQPTATLNLASSDLGTTLAGIAWTGSNLSTGYKLSDQYLELPVLPLAATSISWRVQENGSTNATGVDWSASGIFSAYSAFYSKSGQNNCIKSRTTRYVAVKVTSCKAAYVYGAANVSVNVYTVGDGQGTAKINELGAPSTATTTATEVRSVTGLDPTKTYIVQIAGSTSSNANAYAMILERDLTPRTGTAVNAAKDSQIAYLDNSGSISGDKKTKSFSSPYFTLEGSNIQSGSNTFTIDAQSYTTFKIGNGSDTNYEIVPAYGATITAAKLYVTSNNNDKACVIDGTTTAKRGATPTQIVLAADGEGKWKFTFEYPSDTYHNQAIIVLKVTYDLPASVDVTISSAGYATLYYNQKLAIPSGVSAFSASVSGANALLTSIEDVIPANTGVILKGDAGTYNFIVTTADAPIVSGNVLKGTTSATTAAAIKTALSATKLFTLGQNTSGDVGLREYTGTDIRAYCAYAVDLSFDPGANFFGFDEDVTAINKVETKKAENGVFYNLAGQRIANPTKGLYIVNGKKVVLK